MLSAHPAAGDKKASALLLGKGFHVGGQINNKKNQERKRSKVVGAVSDATYYHNTLLCLRLCIMHCTTPALSSRSRTLL